MCSVFEPPASAIDERGAKFDAVGGMQEHTGSLTRALDAHGVVQVVLTTRPPTAPWVERITPRATIVRVGLPVPRPRQLYALPAAVLAPILGRRADIVHVHLGEDLAIVPLAALAARAGGAPVVMTVHCSLAYTLRTTGLKSAILHSLGGLIERTAEGRAAATLVYTQRLARLIRQGPGRPAVHIVRRGVNRRAFADPGRDPFPDIPGRPRVVFLGRIVGQKGVATLVRAVARLRTTGAQILFVGDGAQRARIERLARELGVADRIRITGFVSHDRVPAVLASADLLVLPSDYEELGTVLLEAMQAGLPVVASRVDGIPEVVEDGVSGLLVPPGEPQALADAIDAVLSDPALAHRLAANASTHAGDHDLDHIAAQIHDLYRGLAAEQAEARTNGRGRRGARGVMSLWPA
jgi:glycogen(starch) synthase